MSFSHHEPCPKCGSRDNLGRFSDGGAFCFGCHYVEKADRTVWNVQCKENVGYPIPEDVGHDFSPACVEWLKSFHLDVPTAIQREMVWSPSREQLIYQMGNVWQARNFNPERFKKSKNFTSGNVNECLHIYNNSTSSNPNRQYTTLVVVEDPLSAIRIAGTGARSDAMPLLGSHLATARLMAIARLYSRLHIWLDSDKWKESVDISRRAIMIGTSSRSIYTKLDPKCYTNKEIEEILQ